ncbi:ribonuclease III [Ameyamaea chiangmaiensis NBRC 103196]|uniref:Ribonuclease 3 n=1 Tax=Ameyamaea chiangmaiensis TaxID=442969 RepID=A0A850PF00_9PROT|nr:ribonuclease III [Ameyamaea chiangmaiensis]MBS4074412.1 ribonuclease III [Ameyamaea chiangmaiensis]NVN40482.1 ribonuclease III [Ameyamaea chiangmaiensis]GBQ71934.1 ribonuclease III [Ameyamaea chiangmaiensis NBRC 103196]
MSGDVVPSDDRSPVAVLEAAIGHRFAKPALLREALTHRSALHDRVAGRTGHGRRGRLPVQSRGAGSNERLEFIGDRVLGLLMAEWLLERFPAEQEGALGPRHANLVSRPVLADIAAKIGLPDVIAVAPHEERAGIRQVANVLADALEAVLGALYLDAGLEPARQFVRRAWTPVMTGQARPPKDPKTALQEWLLGRGLPLPSYETVSMEGPSHAPLFVIRVSSAGRTGEGQAGSKRAAESGAAANLLSQLDEGEGA